MRAPKIVSLLLLIALLGFAACGGSSPSDSPDDPDTPIAATPTVLPPAGDYETPLTIALASATEGAAIYYTLDGSTPTAESALYNTLVPISKTTTIKAIAVKTGMTNSAILTVEYRFTKNAEDFGPDEEVDKVFSVASTSDWNTALTEIRDGGDDKNYIINITEGFEVEGSTDATFGTVTDLKVSIRGDETVSMDADGIKGTVLRIIAGQDVIIRDVDFLGMTDNMGSLINLSSGTLTLRDSASVKGNKISFTSYAGGGVYIHGGTLIMRDTAAVSGNATYAPNSYGGGVYIGENGTLTMLNEAVISGNETSAAGAGIFVDRGTFTMEDSAKVSGNTISNADSPVAADSPSGGGVYIGENGIFTMRDAATIFDNTASTTISNTTSNGGGVYVAGGTFIMEGSASVSGNKVSTTTSWAIFGGGVYVKSGTFTMRNTAFVSGNISSYYGGGVYVAGGTVTIEDSAFVSGNIAYTSAYGGGVYVHAGTFQITGGTVYGGNEGDNSNKADYGAALYKYGGTAQYGTLDGDTFTSKGNLVVTSDDTIKVIAGVLQKPSGVLADLDGTTWEYKEGGADLKVVFTKPNWVFSGSTPSNPNVNMEGTYTISSPGNIVFSDGESEYPSTYTETTLQMVVSPPDNFLPFTIEP